jgi:tetratricopeptide (TPR) repeat protein
MSAIAYFFGILLFYMFTIFSIVLLHELGHALMGMSLTKGVVHVHIGSYVENHKSFQVKTGRITTYVNYNPTTWIRGRCILVKTSISNNRQIAYILGGPAMSILTGIIILYIFQNLQPGHMAFAPLFFGLNSIFVGVANLLPITFAKQSTGIIITSDGYKLLQLLRLKALPAQFSVASELFTNKQFEESSSILQTLVESGNKNKHILRLAISASIQAKLFDRGEALMTIFLNKHLPNSNDYCNAGYLKSKLKDEEVALKLYKKSLALNSGNVVALSNAGHSLNELGRYAEAIPYLDAAISESPKFCPAYANLAFAKINEGDLEAGMEVIQVCLEIDPNFSDTHTCLGIYHVKKDNLLAAKACFEKSKELGSDNLANDAYLKEIEEKLARHN